MARQRNTLALDTSKFYDLLTKVEGMGKSVRAIVNSSLADAADKIANDTEAALAPGNLPAGGQYSTGRTMESITREKAVRWDGFTAWIPVGFDFSLPGAGGYLITGTPRMKPDHELNRIYKQSKYMATIQTDIEKAIFDYLEEDFEGKA